MKKIILCLACILMFWGNNLEAQWQSIGPYGGNARCMVAKDSNIYICTSNSVYKSYNGENNWIPIRNGIISNSINSLSVTSSMLYAGTSDEGIFRSDNGGTSWTQVNNGLVNNKVRCLFAKDNIVYAATYDTGTGIGGVHQSEDGGNNWTQIGLPGMDVQCITVLGSNIYAGVANSGIYKKEIGGSDWAQIGLPLMDIRCIIGAGSSIYAGTSIGVFKSDDGGQNWIQNGLTNQNVFNLIATNNTIYAATWGNGVYKYNNGNNNWTPINGNLNSLNIYSIATIGTKIYVSTMGSICKTENEGNNWTIINNGINEISVKHLSSYNSAFFAGTDKGVFKSIDSGNNWINSGLVDRTINFVLHSNSKIYVATDNGVYKSNRDTSNWTQIGFSNRTVYCLYRIGSSILAGTKEDGLYKSDNDGVSWTRIALPLMDIYCIYNVGATIYVGTSSGIFRSEDSGINWNRIGFPYTKVFCLTVDGSTIYVGTNGKGVTNAKGLYKTDNGGNSWTRIVATNNDVTGFSIYGSIIYVGTAGAGVFHSEDNGINWRQINYELKDLNINYLSTFGSSILIGNKSGTLKTTIIQPPTNLSPDSNSIVMTTSEFSWASKYSSPRFHIQFADDNGFSNIICDSVINEKSLRKYFANNKKIYWRIRTILASDTSNWSSVMNVNTKLPAPSLALPLTNSNVLLISKFSWTSNILADHSQLQFAMDSNFVNVVSYSISDTTFKVCSLPKNSKIYWRVRSILATDTTDWSSSRSVNTTMPAPTLSVPAINTTVLPTSTLSWISAYPATHYQLQFAPDNSFANLVTEVIVDTTFKTCTLTNNQRSYWRVRAIVGNDTSNWSEIRYFNTSVPAPTLSSPSPNEYILPTSKFVWINSFYANYYQVQFATNSTFSNIINSAELDSSNITRTFSNNTRLYWRVRSILTPDTSNWSSVRSFQTYVPVPTLVTPSVNANVIPISKFTWNSSLAAKHYVVQFALDSAFANVINNSIAETTSLTQTLPNNSKIFWRVKSIFEADTSNWSSIQYFNTYLPVPTLTSPSTNANVIPISKFTWSSGFVANHYIVQFAMDSAFTNVINNSVTDTAFIRPTLPNNSKIFWRVKSILGADTSNWSSIKYFNTYLPAPVLALPSSNSNVIPISKFTWSSGFVANHYIVQFALDSAFANVINNSIADTTFLTQTLPNNSKIFWRVRSILGIDTSNWSSIRYCNTNLPAPVTMNHGVAKVFPISKFSWSSNFIANHFIVQFALDSAFISIINSAIVDSAFITQTLPNNSKIFWRVKAILGTDTTLWSSLKYFYTELPIPVLVLPSTNTNIILSSKFTWNSSFVANQYKVQFAIDSLFSNIISYRVADTTYLQQSLPSNTRVYWRVRAMFGTDSSNWSAVKYCNIIMPSPTLVSPAINANVMPTTQFNWSSSFAVERYQIRFATDSLFTNTINSIIVNDSFAIQTLPNNSKVYWQVRSIIGTDTSNWSIKQYCNTNLPAPILSSPAPNATINLISDFRWTSTYTANQYQVQFALDSTMENIIIDSIVDVTSIRRTLPNNTRIYWRVRSILGTDTSNWTSIQYFTTKIPIPYFINQQSTICPTSQFQLYCAIVADYYQFQFCPVYNNFQNIINEGITDTNFITITLPNNMLICGRVRAIVGTDTSAWSSTNFSYYGYCFNTILSVPTLSTPASNALVSPTSMYKWSSSCIAEYYQVQFATDNAFTNIVNDEITNTSTINSTLPNNQVLYWRVRSFVSTNPSNWSSVRSVRTSLSGPTLTSPVQEANIPLVSKFSWTPSFVAEHYQIQFSENESFESILSEAISDTTFITATFPSSRWIFWRVRAIVGADTSAWSSYSYFTTYLPAPTITLPLNRATVQPRSTRFTWNTIYQATAHHVQFATDSLFINIVSEANTELPTISNSFPNYSTIFWRVQSTYEGEISLWSNVSKFEVLAFTEEQITIDTGTSAISFPFNTYWHDSRTQILITADELYASGANPGVINQIGFNVSQAESLPMNSFTIKMQPTTLTTLSSRVLTNWTTCFATPSYTVPGIGWCYFRFSQDFDWDGMSNILIDICFNNDLYSTSSIVYGTVKPNMTYEMYGDELNTLCTDANPNTNNASGVVSNIRPNIRLGNYLPPSILPVPPVLVYPAELALDIETTSILAWDSVPGATKYKVQVATSNTFDTLVVNVETSNINALLSDLNQSTTYYWRVRSYNEELMSNWSNARSFTTKFPVETFTLSGTLKYANIEGTRMNNCTIIINNGTVEVARTTTDSIGNYSISGLTNGMYNIQILTTKTPGGINSLDILPIKQKLANTLTLTPIKIKAADINNNGALNSLDILPMNQKLANQAAPNWLIPNFVYYPLAVTIDGANAVLNIEALCGGDVNGSFVPDNE